MFEDFLVFKRNATRGVVARKFQNLKISKTPFLNVLEKLKIFGFFLLFFRLFLKKKYVKKIVDTKLNLDALKL